MNRKTNDAPSDLELMLYADGELDADRAAAVEAYLGGLRDSASQGAASKLAAMGLVSSVVRERALDAASPADKIADAVMAAIDSGKAEPEKSAKVTPIQGKRGPANDNARGIFALAAIAVAAAAAMMLWGRGEPPSQTADRPPVVVESTGAQPVPVPATVDAPKAEADVMHGVEVAAVDFGAVSGAIFYVPTEAARAGETTTVVWLSDDGAGGN